MSNREPRSPKGAMWLKVFLWVTCGIPVIAMSVLVTSLIFRKDTPLHDVFIATCAGLTILWMLLLPVLGGIALAHRGKKIKAPQHDVLAK